MLKRSLLVLLLLAGPAMADTAYSLRMNASVHDAKLTIAPTVGAPAGSRLRYEVVSTKEGASGKSSTRQGGQVRVGNDGAAPLSKLTFSITPQDRYVITVKVFDGAKLVAEDVLRHPQ